MIKALLLGSTLLALGPCCNSCEKKGAPAQEAQNQTEQATALNRTDLAGAPEEVAQQNPDVAAADAAPVAQPAQEQVA